MTVQEPDVTHAAMFAILTAYLFWGCWGNDWEWTWSVGIVLMLLVWAALGVCAVLWFWSLIERRTEVDP